MQTCKIKEKLRDDYASAHTSAIKFSKVEVATSMP